VVYCTRSCFGYHSELYVGVPYKGRTVLDNTKTEIAGSNSSRGMDIIPCFVVLPFIGIRYVRGRSPIQIISVVNSESKRARGPGLSLVTCYRLDSFDSIPSRYPICVFVTAPSLALGPIKSVSQSVGIALSYGLDDWGSTVRFPAGSGKFSLHHRFQNGSGPHPASYSMGTRGSIPGGEAATHSPPSSAEVKNAWSYTSTPPIRLDGVVLS
jgi:hypothetical protein